MKTFEKGVLSKSNIYFHSTSPQGKNMFFYPLCTGHYFYEPSYSIERNDYHSYLIMFIKKGCCYVNINGQTCSAKENDIVFLNCHKPHHYYAENAAECIWIHFDGPCANHYYTFAVNNFTNIITLKDTYIFEKYLTKLYQMFHHGENIKEAVLSKNITCLLTELLVSSNNVSIENSHSDTMEDCIAYIHENISGTLSIGELSDKASLSNYYFIRLFKKETGFTPHEYIIHTRISTAKYFLKATSNPIKEIALNCGFSSESNFSTAFRKYTGTTPAKYRTAT